MPKNKQNGNGYFSGLDLYPSFINESINPYLEYIIDDVQTLLGFVKKKEDEEHYYFPNVFQNDQDKKYIKISDKFVLDFKDIILYELRKEHKNFSGELDDEALYTKLENHFGKEKLDNIFKIKSDKFMEVLFLKLKYNDAVPLNIYFQKKYNMSSYNNIIPMNFYNIDTNKDSKFYGEIYINGEKDKIYERDLEIKETRSQQDNTQETPQQGGKSKKKSLDKCTVAELKERAKKRSIKVTGLKKAEIISKLRNKK